MIRCGRRIASIAAFLLVPILVPLAAYATEIAGQRLPETSAHQETTAEIMARQAVAPAPRPRPDRELESPDRRHLPQNPDAQAISQYPPLDPRTPVAPNPSIHTTSLAFDGPTLTDTGAFPPDSMGTVGPTQFITFVNGRLRSFTKAGVADGVLNADPDVFFASVTTPVSPPVVLDFTSDPQIRYDRVSGRWFLLIIDVPCTNASCSATVANRVMIAVSDAASNGTISGGTVWTFFYFVGNAGSNFLDYPALGIDVNALYIGGNMFSSAGAFVGTNGYVVQKSSILGAGPIVSTLFANLASGSGAGPYTPRGVDNFDVAATEGYFIGVDNATFSTLMMRRVSNPGSATPTISGNISITVPTTQYPNPVEHLGNTGGNNGRLDSLDDRLYEAMIRNGRLWTAHNFRVTAAGVASTAAQARNASRWYELQNLTATPTIVQSGTVFDSAATRAASYQYFIPSIAVTGQGHAVIGFTAAGVIGATPAYTGRLSGDALGSMSGSPGTGVTTFGTSTANYNPPSDPGGSGGRRWGDYSFTSVDPLDDMTVWTIQEYNQATNSYAVRVGKLLAPPPATPTCSGTPIVFNGPTGNVVIAATSTAGSGFYDPGSNLPPPALPFNHMSATVSNAAVNTVSYDSPTQVTLNITAAVSGLQDVTLTNPDGQSVIAAGCIDVQSVAVNADLSITKTDGVTTATAGGSVTYTITAGNAGPGTASGATVADTFPASLTCTWTCVGAGGGTCTAAGSGNINDSVNLPSGGSTTYTASCAISPAAIGSLDNTAAVTAPGGVTDPTPGNNSATDTDALNSIADLSITKTDFVPTATPGGAVSYTITVSNAGPSGVLGALVSDTVASSLSQCNWSCNGTGGGSCTTSGSGNIVDAVDLPVGATVTFGLACTIAETATGSLVNTTTVAAPDGVIDPTPSNNSATDINALLPEADVYISKSDGVTTAIPGGSATYSIVAASNGLSASPGSTVTDIFPPSLTCAWTCAGSDGATCAPSGSGNIGDTVNLPVGGSVSYTAVCTIASNASGSLSNTATVTTGAGVTDPTPGNNSATDTDALAVSADINVTMTDGRNFVEVGDSLDYLIEVSNPTGPSAAIASVSDILPALLGAGSWTCTGSGGASCGSGGGSGNTLSDTATLPVGGKTSYLYSATLQAVDPTDLVQNTATAIMTNGSDPDAANNAATDTDIVVIFRDGFDPGSQNVVEILGTGTDYVTAQLRVDGSLLASLGIVPASVASGQTADGKILFTLELARFGNEYSLRVITRDALGQAERSHWQVVDMSERLLGFAWQSAASSASDGFLEVQGMGLPLLVSGRSEQGQLTRLLVRIDNRTPWLMLITR